MISSSKPFEIEGDLEVSLLGAFRSSLLFCSTEKKPTSLLGRLTLFAQGSHTAVCTEMSGKEEIMTGLGQIGVSQHNICVH